MSAKIPGANSNVYVPKFERLALDNATVSLSIGKRTRIDVKRESARIGLGGGGGRYAKRTRDGNIATLGIREGGRGGET